MAHPAAGRAVLKGIAAKPADQLKPATLFSDIIEDIADQHAVILNRTREASMILPGQFLLVYEQLIGASMRECMAGERAELARIDKTPQAIVGREGSRAQRSDLFKWFSIGHNQPMKLNRITIDPKVCTGKPCIRGLRFPVARLLGLLAAGETREQILASYPYLESGDIDEALLYAAYLADDESVELAQVG